MFIPYVVIQLYIFFPDTLHYRCPFSDHDILRVTFPRLFGAADPIIYQLSPATLFFSSICISSKAAGGIVFAKAHVL